MSLASFRNRNYAPPGGTWFYTVPETKQYFDTRESMGTLESSVKHHYALNSIPIPANLRELIEDHICKQVGGTFCTGDTPSADLDFFTVMQASELLFRKHATDFFVPLRQADERARVCVTCPLNVKHMCTTCNGLREMFRRMVSNRTSKYDPGLGVCAACGCGLAAKIHINRKYLAGNPKKRQDYPEHCWLVTEGKAP